MGDEDRNVMMSDKVTAFLAKLDGEFISGTTNATPNTEDTLTHTLGRVPKGFIVVGKDKAGDVYDGGTANTDTNLNIKCAVASVTVKIYVF